MAIRFAPNGINKRKADRRLAICFSLAPPAGLEQHSLALVATSHLSVASSGQMASSPCGLDDRIAAISSLRTVNIANHDGLMVRTRRRKGTKKTDTRLRVCLFVGSPGTGSTNTRFARCDIRFSRADAWLNREFFLLARREHFASKNEKRRES